LRAGDEEAAGGGVLAGVVDGAGAHVVVRPLVRGHHVAGVVLVPLHTLLHVAPFRRAPVVVPVYESSERSSSAVGAMAASRVGSRNVFIIAKLQLVLH
jgi:hypothetical protein